jgi:hypothetical protein
MHDKWISDWVAKMYPGRDDKEVLKRVVEWDFMPDSFEVLSGRDFKEWKGMLCVGGTIEGCVRLERREVNGKCLENGRSETRAEREIVENGQSEGRI